MATILHKINIDAPKEKVYQALATLEGLKGWWTSTTEGESRRDGIIDFRFGEHSSQMAVSALEPGERVAWQCVASVPDWVGTELTFQLEELEARTTVRFRHAAWKEAGDFFSHCSTKWATFLVSLKNFVETGEGRPFPHDQPI